MILGCIYKLILNILFFLIDVWFKEIISDFFYWNVLKFINYFDNIWWNCWNNVFIYIFMLGFFLKNNVINVNYLVKFCEVWKLLNCLCKCNVLFVYK